MNVSGLEFDFVMNLLPRDNLPFVSITVTYQGIAREIHDVLVDTGSATTILATDAVAAIGMMPMPEDILHTIRGVGGVEVVFRRELDSLQLETCMLREIAVDIGGMDYGFQMNGILGMDVLQAAGAIINLQTLHMVVPSIN